MNDGLECPTPETPKWKTRTSYPPNGKGPTPGCFAAQCISSPEKSLEATTVSKRNEASALKGIPPNIVTGTIISPEPSTLTGVQNLPADPLATPSLPGVPIIPQTATEPIVSDLNMESLPDQVVDDTTANVHVAPDKASTSQAKATETFNVEPLSTDNEAKMDVVDALLSLSSVRDNVEDPTLENEQLVPIGGVNLPVDAALVPIELGQVQVNHAIAELAEQDEIQTQAAAVNPDADDVTAAEELVSNVTTENKSKNTIGKGVFKTTMHTLRKKTENK